MIDSLRAELVHRNGNRVKVLSLYVGTSAGEHLGTLPSPGLVVGVMGILKAHSVVLIQFESRRPFAWLAVGIVPRT